MRIPFAPLLPLILVPTGCVVVSVPVSDLVTAVVSGTSEVAGMAENKKMAHPRLALTNVCVEWNDQVSIPDFLPFVQSELRKYGVESRVFSPGTTPAGCDATLNYTAAREWDRRLLRDDVASYMTSASLILYKDNKILSQASYQMKGVGFDKWASTSTKLAPVVEALLYDY
ncbi:MAG: hypothetical protein QM639_17125 [Rhodocyclaceae bacterium]